MYVCLYQTKLIYYVVATHLRFRLLKIYEGISFINVYRVPVNIQGHELWLNIQMYISAAYGNNANIGPYSLH